jgi:hypothetical protein
VNQRTKLTIGIGMTVLLLAVVFATSAFAQGPGGGFGGMTLAPALRFGASAGVGGQGFDGMMGGRGFGGMLGGISQQGFGGMMGRGLGMLGYGNASSGTVPAGCPMFGGPANPASAQPITFDKAVEAAQGYLKDYDNADLKLAEVMEFDNNFYVLVAEKTTGAGAFELLVNRYTGYVGPEPGPNMMWNTKYGPMAGRSGMMGMMGGNWNQQTGPMTITVQQARTAAQGWLDANQPGAKLADDEMQFYGHYTMDFLKDGKTAGMLSVNGYTGQVWYHTWHGSFISEKLF